MLEYGWYMWRIRGWVGGPYTEWAIEDMSKRIGTSGTDLRSFPWNHPEAVARDAQVVGPFTSEDVLRGMGLQEKRDVDTSDMDVCVG